MKKSLITGAALLAFTAGTLFANVEMDLNLHITPSHTYKTEYADEDVRDAMKLVGFDGMNITQKTGFGIDTQFGFFFGAPAKFVDLGLNLGFGADMFFSTNAVTVKDGSKVSYLDIDIGGFGANLALDLGPVARFHLGDMHAFYVSPGIRLNFGYFGGDVDGQSGTYVGFISITPAFNLDLGYRFWFLNKQGFHLGLNVGTDLMWDFGGVALPFGDLHIEDLNVKSGFGANIYLGLCFNFGDKAPDIHR